MAFSTSTTAPLPSLARTDVFTPSPTVMTSQFTPPSGCRGRLFTTYMDGRNATALWDYQFGDSSTLSCSDKTWIDKMRERLVSTSTGLFSSAVLTGLCPSGYNVVATDMATSGSTYYFHDTAEGGAGSITVPGTSAWCCPSGFKPACQATSRDEYLYTKGDQYACESLVASQTTLLAVLDCFDVTGACTPHTSTMTTSSIMVLDRGYLVKWDAVCRSYFTPTAYVDNLATNTITSYDGVSTYFCADPSTSTTAAAAATASSDHGGDSLSGGAIGGIAGGIVGVMALILIYWAISSRRTKQKPANQPNSTSQVSEVHGRSSTIHEAGLVANKSPVSELSRGNEDRSELASPYQERHELAPGYTYSNAVYELPDRHTN